MSAITIADQSLINKAEKCHYRDWDIVDGFIDLAQSQEAKKILRDIRNYLQHKEEFACGNL